MSLPAARSSSLRCLSREERSDFEQIRRSGEARTRSGEVERGVRRSLLNTSYSSEEILAAASTGEKSFHRIKLCCDVLLADRLSSVAPIPQCF